MATLTQMVQLLYVREEGSMSGLCDSQLQDAARLQLLAGRRIFWVSKGTLRGKRQKRRLGQRWSVVIAKFFTLYKIPITSEEFDCRLFMRLSHSTLNTRGWQDASWVRS